MARPSGRGGDKADLILGVAREIIGETGDFDLPMRTLAARAQVSMRTPYQLFGSKRGLVSAILLADQAVFKQVSADLASTDTLDNIFDRVRFGISFYADKEHFYRALFRAVEGHQDSRHDPVQDNLRSFQILASRAQRDGFLTPDANIALLGETLSHLFASNLRTWALGAFNIQMVHPKVGYGFALALSGVATTETRIRLAGKAAAYQRELAAFGPVDQRPAAR